MLRRLSILCVALAPVSAGCGGGEAAHRSEEPSALATVAARSRVAESASADAAEAAAEEPEQLNESTPALSYVPPFPDRQDPFLAPKQNSRAVRRGDGDSSESVELLGFADLGQPSAVLAINGEVKLVAQGQTASGVEVLKIAPPRAVLKRGRTRWTSSIE